jgi:hypothetical protein
LRKGLRALPVHENVLAILLDPVALVVLLVLLLYGTPGDAVGAVLALLVYLSVPLRFS